MKKKRSPKTIPTRKPSKTNKRYTPPPIQIDDVIDRTKSMLHHVQWCAGLIHDIEVFVPDLPGIAANIKTARCLANWLGDAFTKLDQIKSPSHNAVADVVERLKTTN
jgi:hypothetical protein